MGIYVKELNKPESCALCYFRPSGTNYCSLLDRNYVNIDKDCPLQEIKVPHGRLIDADEMKRIWQGCEFKGDISCLVDVRPTVIEAEAE